MNAFRFRLGCAICYLLCTYFAAVVMAQDPLVLLPHNYRVVYENSMVRVVHVTYGPHETLPVHDHSKMPTVYVYLSDSGPVRFTHVEEHAFTLFRAPLKAGTFRVSPGRVERHEVENAGSVVSQFFRVELKTVPLGFQAGATRSTKTFAGAPVGISQDFTCSYFEVERVVATSGHVVNFPPQAGASLLIPFSTAAVDTKDCGKGGCRVEKGQVLWLEGERTAAIRSRPEASAELLRILFHSMGS